MSGSHFIVQTNKFFITNATVVTLGQGDIKVTQYISKADTIFVPDI